MRLMLIATAFLLIAWAAFAESPTEPHPATPCGDEVELTQLTTAEYTLRYYNHENMLTGFCAKTGSVTTGILTVEYLIEIGGAETMHITVPEGYAVEPNPLVVHDGQEGFAAISLMLF